MKFSVLINNYNYGRYLCECVESALSQSYPAHEIIVVDDGSTDDSLHILNKYFENNHRVTVIPQANQGQMAAIARGIETATGDIICLLDSDDRYKTDYLATLKMHYSEFPRTDLAFCRFETFGEKTSLNNESIWLQPQKDYDYGYTALLTYFGNVRWLGNYTSTISLRIRLARTLNLHEVARAFYIPTSADFSVLLGASLLGGRKYYLHRALIDYRIHEVNHYKRRRSTVDGQYMFNFYDLVRYQYFKRLSCISEEMFRWLDAEAQTIPDPDPKHLEYYRKIQSSKASPKKISWTRKLERKLRSVRKKVFGLKIATPSRSTPSNWT